MQIVDAVEIHVLSVPSKWSFPHPKIEIRSIHPLNGNAALILYYIQNCIQMANIPLIYMLKESRKASQQY